MNYHDSPYFAGVTTGTEAEWRKRNLFEDTPSSTPRVKVEVERLKFRALNGSIDVWLRIRAAGTDRESLRPPNENDRFVLSTDYPGFFSSWFNGPHIVSYAGEWIAKEWFLLPACEVPPSADE